jgi:tetratricopeptide (TPR) repeat protein
MLNLAESLLGMGRTRQQLGRVQDAFAILSRLSRFRELPKDIAEETQARLGEIQLRRKKYTRARRHLAVAVKYDPDNARYHLLLARALREQDSAQWEEAAERYRQALRCDPDNLDVLTELGLLCVRLGQPEEGLKHLRRAVELRPTDPETLGKLVKGLRLAGRSEEARTEIRGAMFRNPRDGRFKQLWNGFQFRMLRREQAHQRQVTRNVAVAEPVLLPFVKFARPEVSAPQPGDVATPMTLPLPRPIAMEQRNVR